MSRTYSIACKTCQKYLWIGQGWPGHAVAPPRIYGGPKHIHALETFLFSHQKHELFFGDDEQIDIDDFEEIEVDDEAGVDFITDTRLG
ncbi:MAG TPA: hypothetical protein ENI15_19135, partial [Spirochaetes bacterium]|nr:hypothetical protein [Spirochaetota bacterium]